MPTDTDLNSTWQKERPNKYGTVWVIHGKTDVHLDGFGERFSGRVAEDDVYETVICAGDALVRRAPDGLSWIPLDPATLRDVSYLPLPSPNSRE